MIQTGTDIHSVSHRDFTRNILALMIKGGRVIPPQMVQVLQGKLLETAEVDPVQAYINHGRWVADCPFCPGAELIFQDDVTFLCLSCFNQEANFKSLPIAFPLNANEIEAALEVRPLIGGRNWKPPKTIEALIKDNKLGIEGYHRSFTAYRTWTTGEIVTAAMQNEQVRDNGVYLKAEADKIDDISVTEVTGSRAIDGTIYQNSTKARIVLVNVSCGSGEDIEHTVHSDASTPPTTLLCTVKAKTGFDQTTVTFVVLPSHYYKITEAQEGVLADWHEWDLH